MGCPKKIVSIGVKSEAVRIALVKWCPYAKQHLGEYLTNAELDGLFNQWIHNHVALWGVFNGSIRVGTLASRIDFMYDGSNQFVLNHCGGGWLKHMDVISPFFNRVALEYNCRAIRVDCGRKALADLMVDKWAFQPYETQVIREVPL